jgi:hypothetical protein
VVATQHRPDLAFQHVEEAVAGVAQLVEVDVGHDAGRDRSVRWESSR